MIVATEHRRQLSLLTWRGVVLVVGEPALDALEKLTLALRARASDQNGAAFLCASPNVDEPEKLESLRGPPLPDGLCPFPTAEAHVACLLRR